jgi:hypothetical protein
MIALACLTWTSLSLAGYPQARVGNAPGNDNQDFASKKRAMGYCPIFSSILSHRSILSA